ncbi:MAG: TonB-dependent receptor [Henriciella sp.]|uniref:TonB-dependent receptor n=1 Tax=Henriciella sp. TaxID=1968823 RepID=UPI0032EF5734
MSRISRYSSRVHIFSALLAGTALATPAFFVAAAQDTEDEAAVEAVSRQKTVTVTATRRSESLTDVPYNISAVSGDELEASNILDEAELLRSVPGVAVVDRGARNAGTLNAARIRGLAVDGNALGDYAVSSVASVSTYVNDTPIFAGFMLKDIERVEVLRGPQGTLYGSGSLGGTVKYITRDPVLGEFGGNVSASLSSVDGSEDIGYAYDGVLNIPLGETMAVRLVGSVTDYPGFVDYVNVYELDANGIPVAPNGVLDPAASYRSVEDADTVEQWMGRGTLLWEPSSAARIKLVHTRQSDDVGGRRQVTSGQDGFGDTYGEYENGSIQLEPSSRDVNSTSLEAEFDVGFATLTSSTSHYDHTGDSVSENTGFYAQAGFLSFYYNYPRPMASAVRTYADEAFVQEVRLVTDGNDTFDYVVGGFYRKQQLQSTQESYLRGFKNWWDAFLPGAAAAVTGDQDFAYRRTENFEELAAFGELTWHASPDFDLTVGARYFDNESKNDTFIDLPLYASVAEPTNANFESSEDDILFKVNASWDFNESDMLYATISEGYRRGGSNAVPLTGTFAEDPRWQIYNSDSVTNYELGVKGQRGDIRYDVSAFLVDWQEPQLNTSTTNWGFFVVQNGQEAQTYGLEASLDGYLDDNWHYSLGYAYVNAELTSDFYAPDRPPPAAPIALDGAMLPGTPEHALNWALDYTTTVGSDWTWFSRVDGYYQSETRNAVTRSPSFNVPLDGFAIWNATTTLSNDAFDLSLWVKNIANEEGVTGVFTEAYMGTAPAVGYFGNANKQLIALPRTFGATVRYKF